MINFVTISYNISKDCKELPRESQSNPHVILCVIYISQFVKFLHHCSIYMMIMSKSGKISKCISAHSLILNPKKIVAIIFDKRNYWIFLEWTFKFVINDGSESLRLREHVSRCIQILTLLLNVFIITEILQTS